MVMGMASTMACLAEAMGLMLPGGAAIPAPHADRLRHAELSGRRAVALAAADTTPDRLMTPEAFHNALVTLHAIGGSTNGLVHLTAIAARRGIAIDLDAFDRLGREVPVLVDLKPSGAHYMEHFHEAGGVPALLNQLRNHLHLDAATVAGGSLGEALDAAEQVDGQTVIRTPAHPIHASGGIAVLRGNLAPDGAVIKVSATSPSLLQHRGTAVVFDSLADLAARIDSPDLDVTPDSVLVLRHAGPKGAPGMPEAGYLPIPRRLAQAGVKDMVRISDARMSGTAFGTIVLHVAPEAHVGGPLALVQTGDEIELDVAARRLNLLVADAELARRRAAWTPPPPDPDATRGFRKLHLDSVQQADRGCDFDFMTTGKPSSTVPLP